MNGVFYGYACWMCGVLAHIFYVKLRAELERRRTCPRCGVLTTRHDPGRHWMAEHWYCGNCIKYLRGTE